MRIEFWIDYLCPISYKTHENLMKALKQLDIKDIEVLYRSYRLESLGETQDLKALWQLNCDDDFADDVALLNDIYPAYTKLKYLDTSKAHQLAHLAKKCNHQMAFNTALLNAYFSEHLDISSEDILLKIALDAGLSKMNVLDTLKDKPFSEAIKLNLENAIIKKIDRVPHIRINGKTNLSGYQSYEDLIIYIYQAKEANESSHHCHGGVCRRRATQG